MYYITGEFYGIFVSLSAHSSYCFYLISHSNLNLFVLRKLTKFVMF